MKKITCTCLAGCLLLVFACTSRYDIEGNLENRQEATVKITTTGPDGGEEIVATGEASEGKFRFSGSVDAPQICFLTVSGLSGRIPLLLENENYRIHVGPGKTAEAKNYRIEGGGKWQSIRNELQEKEKNIYRVNDSLVELYQGARQSWDVIEMSIVRKQLDSLSEQYNALVQEYIRRNSDNPAGLTLVYERLHQLPYKQLKARYELLDTSMRNTPEGRVALRQLNKLGSQQIGSRFPDFRWPTLSGDTISLADLNGKVKLIDFWASWCGPCRAENPNLRRMYEKYKNKGFVVVGVSMDTKKEAWEHAIQEDNLPWIQVSDLKGMGGSIAKQFNIRAIPQVYLLDADNKIVAIGLRGKALEEMIDQMMQ